MTFYIYTILNILNYKMYVGQTTTPKDRWISHRSEVKRNKKQYPIYHAIRKYGIENFQYAIIESCKTLEEIDQLETYWISLLNTRDPQMGYNLALGGRVGMRGRHHTAIAKEKISQG